MMKLNFPAQKLEHKTHCENSFVLIALASTLNLTVLCILNETFKSTPAKTEINK